MNKIMAENLIKLILEVIQEETTARTQRRAGSRRRRRPSKPAKPASEEKKDTENASAEKETESKTENNDGKTKRELSKEAFQIYKKKDKNGYPKALKNALAIVNSPNKKDEKYTLADTINDVLRLAHVARRLGRYSDSRKMLEAVYRKEALKKYVNAGGRARWHFKTKLLYGLIKSASLQNDYQAAKKYYDIYDKMIKYTAPSIIADNEEMLDKIDADLSQSLRGAYEKQGPPEEADSDEAESDEADSGETESDEDYIPPKCTEPGYVIYDGKCQHISKVQKIMKKQKSQKSQKSKKSEKSTKKSSSKKSARSTRGVVFLRTVNKKLVKDFKTQFGSTRKDFDNFYKELKEKGLLGKLGGKGKDYKFGPYHEAAFKALKSAGPKAAKTSKPATKKAAVKVKPTSKAADSTQRPSRVVANDEEVKLQKRRRTTMGNLGVGSVSTTPSDQSSGGPEEIIYRGMEAGYLPSGATDVIRQFANGFRRKTGFPPNERQIKAILTKVYPEEKINYNSAVNKYIMKTASEAYKYQ
jgi:hypothetical protein